MSLIGSTSFGFAQNTIHDFQNTLSFSSPPPPPPPPNKKKKSLVVRLAPNDDVRTVNTAHAVFVATIDGLFVTKSNCIVVTDIAIAYRKREWIPVKEHAQCVVL